MHNPAAMAHASHDGQTGICSGPTWSGYWLNARRAWAMATTPNKIPDTTS
jgi:hypothetical protein